MAQSIGIVHVWKQFLVIYCLLLTCVSSTCYYDSGTIAPEYTPCNVSAIGTTHCCQNGHACLTTGLCMVSWDTSVNTGSCTDQTWDSPACFRKCPGRLGALNTLYRCDENQWCCSLGGNTTTCCQDPNVDFFELNGANNPSRVMGGSAFIPGYTIAPVAALEASETPRNLSCVSTQSEAPSVSSSALDENASPSPEVCLASGKDGMKAGLGAGLGIGLPSIAALAALLFFLLRERRINRELRRQNGVVPHMVTHNAKGHNNPHELYSGFAAAELSNGHCKVQLPA
ncbi:hypothetical protein XPA_003146 [Xanthoria parietina]